MAQQTTANTEIADYPTPSPLNRIGIKVALGMGLLLSLFVIAALVALFQARIVDEKVHEITEVEQPTSVAAYEMEINVIGTGLGVLKYLQTGDEIHRRRVAKDAADFERFKAQYDRLVETPRGKELGDRVSLLYQQYKALGDTLMDQTDERAGLFIDMADSFQAIDNSIDQKLEPTLNLQGHDGMQAFHQSMRVESDIAEAGLWLGTYLRTQDSEYQARMLDNLNAAREHLTRLLNLRLTEEQQYWATELEIQFNQVETLAQEIIALEDDITANLANFAGLRTKLDTVLDDEIQVLTHQDLAEATWVAHNMEARITTLLLSLPFVGLACGILTAVAITRGIIDPVNILVSASRAIARGDLSQRVEVQTKDEFGILGEAFNEMTAQRQRAQDELEVRVQERTAELSRVYEVIGVVDEVARIITSTLNIDEVFEKFALEVKKLVDFDRMNINIIDYERNIFEIKYQFGEEAPQRPVGANGALKGTTTGQVADTGQTLVQHDIALDARSLMGEKYLKMGLRSNVKVPLIIKGRVVGTMGFRSREVAAYGPREQAILERLAGQIAPALENSQLYQRLQGGMEEMELADEVGRIVTTTLDIDEVFEKFALQVKKLVDYDRMSINIIDYEREIYEIKYQFGQEAPQRPVSSIGPLASTATGQVADTGRTVIQPDIALTPRTTSGGRSLKMGLRSNIKVPLITKGKVFGTLGLRSRQQSAYGPREQAILERLASQIAPAMVNARLHQERVLTEEKFSHAQKMESVGRLAGGVAHDFNNLLTAIMGYSELSLREAPPESLISNHLQEIQQASERASNLTNQLLAFSRHQVIEPKVVDLNDLTINLDKMLRRLIGEDIELVTLPTAGLEPIKADPGQIEQVLMNLAVNAQDAMPNGGNLPLRQPTLPWTPSTSASTETPPRAGM